MARIMVADDNVEFRRTLGRLLESAGHEVVLESDGSTAWTAYRRESFDLLIADVYMPSMDGLQLLIRVRNRSPEARVIVMSAGGRFAKDDLLRDAVLLGAVDVLRKPFTREELDDAVDQALDSSLVF